MQTFNGDCSLLDSALVIAISDATLISFVIAPILASDAEYVDSNSLSANIHSSHARPPPAQILFLGAPLLETPSLLAPHPFISPDPHHASCYDKSHCNSSSGITCVTGT
ncbi:hypothetical protein CONPUDRAFT_155681 [Coniophora puteana RWD-64-598 SS2]|uniref:Uncharacterized protein n=1 Tax=Coniophora puteana (strain RWD-64-598) TaxID=741705 RepID=A0A5M3MK05_CONPW|nr:uncharacterized protein CONPUDRAFT_155681 [Coniophora puteana RWD-64-598 SS2]EIW78995.1 hypothetical protein CONPUDRAFT_155681 [Coniophora puteana RWD-64-598 SS2]